MFSNAAKLIQTTVVIAAISAAAMAPSTASAGFLGDVVHAVKSVDKVVVKAVTHPKQTVKDVEHDVKSVGQAVTHPKQLVQETAHLIRDGRVMKDLHAVGKVVGDAYDDAAKVAKNIPVAKEFTPLMRDVARAARSSEGEIGAAAGVAAAVATGGSSYALTQAGGWGYATFAGKREVKRAQAAVRAEIKSQQNALRQY
jgi:hypothetical protein